MPGNHEQTLILTIKAPFPECVHVSVCVCSRKGQSGTSVGFTPGNWAYISHRAYARLFKVAK